MFVTEEIKHLDLNALFQKTSHCIGIGQLLIQDIKDAFHSTKNFENVQTGIKWYWNFLVKFSENSKIVEELIIQPKTPEMPEGKPNGSEFRDIEFPKISVYLTRLSTFSEIQKIMFIRHWRFPKIQTAIFHRMESVFYTLGTL